MISTITIDKIITIVFDYLIKSNLQNNIANEFDIKSGFAFKSTDYIENFKKGILNFRVTNINFDGTTDLSNNKYINNNLLNQYEDYLLNEGDVLLVMVGGSLGKVGYIDSKVLPSLMNQNLWRFIPKEKDNYDSKYVFYLIKYLVLNKLETRNSGHGHISKEVFKKNNVPIISKDLQISISKYIDDLNNGIINDFFIENLDFEIKKIINNDININNLFALNDKNLSYIKQLKQAILQEAIEGKLTSSWRENNPNIEPASVLLEKIKKEKEELVKQKKLKKQKELKEISEDEILFKIPEKSVICRLGDIIQVNPRNQLEDNLDVSFIPMKLINDGFINTHTSEKMKWSDIKSGFTHFKENDVVFAKITPCFQNRKSAVMKNLINGFGAGTTELIVLRSFNNLILPELLLYFVKSKGFIDLGVSTYTGTAGQQRVDREKLLNMHFLLPPLEEQKEIVKKVDEMMKFCDELEKQSLETKENSENLMKSVLSEVFNK